MADNARDVHSFAQPETARVRHLDLDLTVSLEDRTLAGVAELKIERPGGQAGPLILDTRALAIETVECSIDGTAYTSAKWTLGEADAILGSALRIDLPVTATVVRIHYQSSPQASGLQWLEPQQTAGKTQPFLFSQNQSIHARSWIPSKIRPACASPIRRGFAPPEI